MTSDQIKKSALKYFAQNGYEGASLSHIATDVGIKNNPFILISKEKMNFSCNYAVMFLIMRSSA
ncbi:hypothetical protein [Bacillus sp. P14.5]|uniref:hypothetical protein n=1 Tax=Bacillus sp. P14.5 TaxID=1983400 RepID=UPI001F0588D1|nr:hypothetical protein [Bacillus sp. P14.5]